jgi:membrane protease YdiL (CAAX protease family)
MATSGVLVAAVTLPVGLLAWAARPRGESFLPRWKPWRVPWNGFAVTAAFIVMAVLPGAVDQTLAKSGFYQAVYGADFPMSKVAAEGTDPARAEEASAMRVLWSSLFALPLLLGLCWFTVHVFYPNWKPAIIGRGSLAGKVWLAVVAWIVITPVVLIFHAGVNEFFKLFEFTPQLHPLTKLGNRPPLDQVLFVVQVCVVAPLIEELFFRGILLSWCVNRIPRVSASHGSAARPWFVMLATGMLAFLPVSDGKFAPFIFAVLLAVGLAVVWRFTRTGARRVRAVYATAALFAIMHSSVWPNPVPLFLFALALGWLAVRTNGILVSVIVHGLFNAVSGLTVLRGVVASVSGS